MKIMKSLAIVALVISGQSIFAAAESNADHKHVPTMHEVHHLNNQLTKDGSKESPKEPCIDSLAKKRETLRAWKDATGRLYDYIVTTLKKAQNELDAARKAYSANLATKIEGMKRAKMMDDQTAE
jgi:hypothetical protein